MANDPRQLFVLGFDNPLKAQEALLAVTRLASDGKLLLHDAVFVAKGEDGATAVQETTDMPPGQAALDGSFWGVLFGVLLGGPVGALVGGAVTAGAAALAAKIVDTGVSDACVKQLRETVTPGTTALALLVSHYQPDALVAELRRFAGASLIETNLPDATVEAVKQALAGGPAAS